jgi:hypothetical protein
MGKDLEGSGHGLFETLSLTLTGETEEKDKKKNLPSYPVLRPEI